MKTKTADVEPDNDGTIVVLNPVLGAAIRVCSARLDTGVEAHEFVDLVDNLIAAVREEERHLHDHAIRVSARYTPVPPADRAKILDAYQAIKKENGGKAPRGTIEQLCQRFGYNKRQVNTVVYK